MDPAKMTPPQRRRMAARVAQLESPSVRAIMEEVKTETESIKRATSVVSVALPRAGVHFYAVFLSLQFTAHRVAARLNSCA